MYVLDHQRQISQIREMTQLRKDSEKWEVYYHDPATNAMWKSFFPKATDERHGPKLLRIEPVPEQLEERLKECLENSVSENAVGLAIELSASPEKWEPIIEILEEKYRAYDRKLVPLFLKNLGIESYQSTFEEIHRDFREFNFTEEKLSDLARRSKIIRYKRFWSFS